MQWRKRNWSKQNSREREEEEEEEKKRHTSKRRRAIAEKRTNGRKKKTRKNHLHQPNVYLFFSFVLMVVLDVSSSLSRR
jgi:Flp pilus assembly protein TadB